jgi:hypothetical protein
VRDGVRHLLQIGVHSRQQRRQLLSTYSLKPASACRLVVPFDLCANRTDAVRAGL